ncbi:FMN adenylyltransferase /riboflavin kinase [Streptohalobacillus salinus]|uniref:Riboflavin biosynthesis protein n=1 Tax=Streptohalobacillus salinus TaxID=621096 RepID=A0A2V3WEA9_9BACI|nr:bifunctional riboflavin kinase/FAD synthetase [Streptohalobacillus salinus]PXW92485.1 FMN adenylyltransferase /riboflavin kinase [Streptohalobacillus salinus]
MKVISLTSEGLTKPEAASAMAIGFFDGVHLGHQQVIKQAKMIAEDNQLKTAVMTFNPHPKEVLANDKGAVSYLTSMQEKEAIFKALGVDILYVVSFDIALAKLSPSIFVDRFIADLNVKHLICGFDFSYGHMGRGNIHTLVDDSQDRFSVTIVEKFSERNEKVSSTRIRRMLKDGNVKEAKNLLTRPLRTNGKVVHGHKRGRTIGYPTANIEVEPQQALPRTGVYYVTAEIDGEVIHGMANLGYNPTFEDELLDVKLEVHFLDYKADLYGKSLAIAWHQFIRPELKFSGVDPLIDQIRQDEIEIRQLY